MGGAVPAVVNAANEVAVAAFLGKQITFPGIMEVVTNTTHALSDAAHISSIDDIFEFDTAARALANEQLKKQKKPL